MDDKCYGNIFITTQQNSINRRLLEILVENFTLKLKLHVDSELKHRLQEVELRFQTIFDQFPLSIQILSVDGKTLLVNDAWKKLWAISEKVVHGYILKDYNMLEDPILKQHGLIDYIKRGLSGEITHIPILNYNTQEAGLDGRTRMVEGLMFPMKGPSGENKEIILIHTDVTEKEKLLEQLKTNALRQSLLDRLTSILISTIEHDQIIAQISDACIPVLADGCIIDLVEENHIHRIVTKHYDSNIQSVMEQMQRLYPPVVDSPQPAVRVIRSGEPEIFKDIDTKTVEANTIDRIHSSFVKQIGLQSLITVPLLIRGKAIGAIGLLITTNRPHFTDDDLITAVEVARRVSLAIENAQLYSRAKKAILQRDEFISIASHELKTPITSMKLQLQLANKVMQKSDGKIDATYFKRVTDMSNKQLDRITVLVEDMLDIARISSGKLAINLQLTDISTLVRSLSGLLTTDIQDDVFAECDSFRLEQVLTNLLTNAIRYGEKKPIKVVMVVEKENVCIKVIDQGRGIDPKDQERIFERFERAISPNNVSGLGLGLYISRQIMEQHKGCLTLESIPGEGSTFTAKLPIKK